MTALKLALGTATVFFVIGGVAFAFNHTPKGAPVQPSQAPLNAAVVGMTVPTQSTPRSTAPAASAPKAATASTYEPATTTPPVIVLPPPRPATTTPPRRTVATSTATTSQVVRTPDQSAFQLADNSWMTYFRHPHRW